MIRFCEPENNWAKNLTLPTRFSKGKNDAIETEVLIRKVRVEIHNTLATLMLGYTSRPTLNDRGIICI